jgi:hypothetical protein
MGWLHSCLLDHLERLGRRLGDVLAGRHAGQVGRDLLSYEFIIYLIAINYEFIRYLSDRDSHR